jgi:rod shape-determining protein MreB
MATDVALDIGTANTRLATKQGVVFNEPTLVAIDTSNGEVVEVGHGARTLIGRTPRHVAVFRPLAQGTTVDFDVTARLVAGLFDRAGVSKLSRARVVMSVPSVATSIERRALRQAAMLAGAREVSLMEAPVAAAIGLGLPVQDPVGTAIAVLGGGASEATLISLGGIVTASSRRLGGEDIEAALAELLRVRFGVVVAPAMLTAVTTSLGAATANHPAETIMVNGRTVDRGQVVEVAISSALVHEAAADVVAATIKMVQECLAEAPPDLSQDLTQQGLHLVGGLAQLRDIAELIALSTGIEVRLSDDPATAVIRGLQLCLDEMSSLHALFRDADR